MGATDPACTRSAGADGGFSCSRVSIHRCDHPGRNSLRAQQRSVRRQIPARNSRLWLRLPGLRSRRMAGHSADQRYRLAGPQEAAHYSPSLSQQRQRHLHRRDCPRRSRCRNVRHGRGGRGLQQRRLPRHSDHLRGAESLVSQHRERHVRRCDQQQRPGKARGIQHLSAVVRLRPRRPARPFRLQLREVVAGARRILQPRRQAQILLHSRSVSRRHMLAFS